MTRDEILHAARAVLAEISPERAAELSTLIEFPATGGTAAAHVTIAEATLVTAIETMFAAELGDRAPDAVARFAHKRTETRMYQRFLFGTMSTADRIEGKDTCSKRQSIPCPACQRTDCVDYVGSDVLEGSLDWVHVVHTEVADWFSCSSCAFSWSEMQHI